jgi:sulfoxide reductase heme-binding subunit YedZ
MYSIHMLVALFGLCLGVVHAGTQLALPGTYLQVIHEFVPFTYPYDPIGIGVGVLGLEVMVASALSVMIQRRLGYSRWRGMHALTYVAFMLVVAHVLISGTDVESPLVWGGVLAGWLFTVVLWFATTPWVRGLHQGAAERATVRQRGQEITVNVNAQKCVRFGFCEHEAPDVFSLRSDGRLAYRVSVSADEATSVIRAAEVCPARAIMLSRIAMTVMTPQSSDPPEPQWPVGVPAGAGPEINGNVTGLRRNMQRRGGVR